MSVTRVYTLNNNLRPTSACYDLIKGFEGFRAKPYYCAGGKLTIGYGTTRGVHKGMTVTHEQAMKMLHDDVVVFGEVVNKSVVYKLNQNQYDALVCFTYNVGEGAFRSSTLLKKLNAGDSAGAASEILRWNKIRRLIDKVLKYVVSDGLVNRRNAEYALFTKPMPSSNAASIG